jgi:hypothetical protein
MRGDHLSADGLSSFLGFQEALIRQVHDLEELLGSEFARVRYFPRFFIPTCCPPPCAFLGHAHWQVGVGRDDGALAGEFSPIFYRR